MSKVSELKAELLKMASRKIRKAWSSPEAAFSAARRPTGAPTILKAAAVLYEKGLRKDQAKLRKIRAKLPAPVISVGNLSVGGTGKTPLTIWICEALQEIGFHPAVLTRGYGSRGKSPGRVPIGCDEPPSELFGDEPVMMSECLGAAPVWVGRDRTGSGRAALAEGGVDVLVLDDGFQHLALERDLNLVLLDCRSPFGNGLLLPAGPLREPCSSLERADAFVLTHATENSGAAGLKKKLEKLHPRIPVFACDHRLAGIRLGRGGPLLSPQRLAGRRAVAFAGIASPESFFLDITNAGIEIRQSFDFPDHHRYTSEDLLRVLGSASRLRAGLIVTTAKDSARLPAFLKNIFAVAEIGIDFGPDAKAFRTFLENRLKSLSDAGCA